MTTPFEELEYLSDYLPEEGESVLVTRRAGELVCESGPGSRYGDGPLDPELYGRLVQWNLRLNALSVLPIWSSVLVFFWGCVLMHRWSGMGWNGWFLDVGLGLTFLFFCRQWITRRQARKFGGQMWPVLDWQLRSRGVNRYVILGVIRQHPELRTLLHEMARWGD